MSYIKIPKILLPKNISYEKWATVACDQFCAEPAYWNELENFVGDSPSTLRLTLAEIYLEQNQKERIESIQKHMKTYVESGLFSEYEGFILVERRVGNDIRVGLIISFDLDAYDWRRLPVPIRATEETIIDRLPPRVEIRRGAPIELPHVLLLADDCKKEIIEPIYEKRNTLEKLYDFELSMHGGRITAYKVDNSEALIEKFSALLNPKTQIEKYGQNIGILLAVGDGNHSVASAKVLWEETKKSLTDAERANHPARFFLAEVVNLYGGGMEFEPIHRVVFGADEKFIEGLKGRLSGKGKVKLLTKSGTIYMDAPERQSESIRAIQEYIEEAVKENKSLKIEYVHNECRLQDVLTEFGGVGIVMPKFPNSDLFNFVVNVGNLPKKAFSIGEPEHKRYYIEAKRIK
ncbi:MAG: DUF1015 domain-containing protein [Firmicutes bacterium]|nr:DUF1015 domain-containing protein [Bacillota bacterium]